MTDTRWRCKSCDAMLAQSELLQAPSPFDQQETLVACPKCRQCSDGFMNICDEPGCNREANCGWPTKDGGYRRTCYKHMEKT